VSLTCTWTRTEEIGNDDVVSASYNCIFRNESLPGQIGSQGRRLGDELSHVSGSNIYSTAGKTFVNFGFVSLCGLIVVH
jgi:hypothetical protein